MNYIVLPLLLLATILSIVSTMSDRYKVTKLSKLLQNVSVGIIGIFLTIFRVLSVQGTATAVADGIAVKTAKFVTGNFIPVVGRMFTEAADTVISASGLLKNTVGIIGLVILCLIVAFPAIQIFCIAFIYKFAASSITTGWRRSNYSMFRHYWKKHHLRICLLSYRIIYVLFKYYNYYSLRGILHL